MGGTNQLDWFSEDLNWSGFWNEPTGFCEQHCGTLQYIDSDPLFYQPLLLVAEI
jgi:hypothetical protein